MSTIVQELERTASTPVEWLPGYELISVLGSGAFGIVFKALQLKLERVVAVKVITLDDKAHPKMGARFETEALTHGKLHHTNIVQVFDRGRHEERLFIAMEFLEGEDLGHRLKRLGPLTPAIAWAIARQTASALAHAHQHGVVHRDIKPANLFLVPAPSGLGLDGDVPLVKVTDFGLALTKQSSINSEPRLTADGIILGTPIYMAPEQYRHSPDLDHRADIYSLGATVAHVLSGHAPFDGPTVWDVMVQKLEHGPSLADSIPLASRRLILDMMAADPKDRPATYAELIAKIDALQSHEPAEPAPSKRTTSRWRILLLAAALAAIFLAPIVFKSSRATHGDSQGGVTEEFVTTGDHYSLIGENALENWLPPASGGVWHPDEDDEGDTVLTGTGFIRRVFEPLGDHRLTLGLDLHEAAAVEMHFAIPAVATEKAPRLVLRVTRTGGATLGTRRGDKGAFATLERTEAIAFPSPGWFQDRKKYLEVRLQRAGGEWSAWFNGQLVGSFAEDGLPKCSELRLFADGGRARVNTVELTPLKREISLP